MTYNIHALDLFYFIQDFMALRGRTYKVNWHYYVASDACNKCHIVH